MAATSRKDLRVDVPSPEADRPSWGRVGAVAVIGFVIGVAWPKLAGIKVGPSAPTDTTASAASADLPAPVAAQVTSSAAASSAAPAPQPVAITVGRGVVLSCKSEDGESLKGKECGVVPSFDSIAQPRLKKLATVPSLEHAKGKLGVVFLLDFKSKKVSFYVGKSSTIKDENGAIHSFLKEQFQDVSLGPLAHDREKYTMSYAVTFGEGSPGATTGTPAASTDATAEVAWDVAIVRDAPHTGTIVARLPRGTKVTLGSSQAGWYEITYGSGNKGWVYRGAIGK
jgi:hypothetical protein